MATSDQIKALLKSHRDGDEERFYAIAMQMAAHAARLGHVIQAKEIRDLIDVAKKSSTSRQVEEAPSSELIGLLKVAHPSLRINEMVLDAMTREKLVRVVMEHRQQHRFEGYDLRPRRKLLLVGPPGTGKTMTASALAGELGLPLYSIMLDGLITKYLGETATKLRLVFDTIRQHKGVYFFDEFDALGARRATANEVGEIRRVLNSFLQFIEEEQSESLVLAATNHIELLDRALFRRFDDVIHYRVPTEDLILETFQTKLSMFDCRPVTWSEVLDAGKGLSYADLIKAAEEAAKEVILHEESQITTKGLTKAIADRQIL